MRGAALSLLTLLVAASACARPCGSQSEPLSDLDGGPRGCMVANDCPRANVLECGSTEDRLLGCVDCVSQVCVEFVPLTECP